MLHHENQFWPSLEDARVIAEPIPNAQLKVLPGAGVGVFRIDARSWIQEVEALLTGTRRTEQLERALATVLFTDFVASTEHAVALGDERWRDLLEENEHVVRGTVDEFDGRLIKSTGDGHLVLFDRPAAAVECTFARSIGAPPGRGAPGGSALG